MARTVFYLSRWRRKLMNGYVKSFINRVVKVSGQYNQLEEKKKIERERGDAGSLKCESKSDLTMPGIPDVGRLSHVKNAGNDHGRNKSDRRKHRAQQYL